MLSPADYDAYAQKKRREDDARKKVLANAETDDPAQTTQNLQIASKVALATGNRPAPPELVNDNKKLFCKIVDDARMDEIRTSAPKLAEWLNQRHNFALAKGDLDKLLPIATTIARIGEAPKVPPLWQAWPEDRQSIPPAPPPTPFGNPGANAVGPLRSAAAKMAPAAGQTSSAAPTTQEDPSGRAVAAPAVPAQTAPAAAPMADSGGQASVSTTPATQENPSANTVEVPGVASTEIAPASVAEGAGQGSVSTTPMAPDGSNANSAATRPEAPLKYTPSPEWDKLSHEIANAGSLGEEQFKDLEARIKNQPGIRTEDALYVLGNVHSGTIQTPEEALYTLERLPLQDYARLVDRIVNAKGKSPEEIENIRRQIPHQNNVDPAHVERVLTAWLGGEQDEAWVREALRPQTPDRQAVEASKELARKYVSIFGEAVEWLGQTTQLSKKELGRKNEFIHAIAYATPEDYDRLHNWIVQQNYIYPQYAEQILNMKIYGGYTSSEALKKLSSHEDTGRMLQDLGKWLQDHSKTMLPAAPGMENSVGTWIGKIGAEITIPVLVGWLSGGGGLVAYGGVRSGGALTSEAREAHPENEDMQTEAAWRGLWIGLATSLPLSNKITQLPAVKNALGKWGSVLFEAGFDGTQNVLQQVWQNDAARSLYDKTRGLFDGWETALVTGAGTSVAGNLGAKFAAAFHNSGTLAELSAQVRSAKEKGAPPEMLRDFFTVSAKRTAAENIYLQSDEFVKAMEGIGANPREIWGRLKAVSEGEFHMAAESGGDLRIPISTFLMDLVGTKEGDALMRYVRFNPHDMTIADAEKYNSQAWEVLHNMAKETLNWTPGDEAGASGASEAPSSAGDGIADPAGPEVSSAAHTGTAVGAPADSPLPTGDAPMDKPALPVSAPALAPPAGEGGKPALSAEPKTSSKEPAPATGKDRSVARNRRKESIPSNVSQSEKIDAVGRNIEHRPNAGRRGSSHGESPKWRVRPGIDRNAYR